jgi:threonine aldolase
MASLRSDNLAGPCSGLNEALMKKDVDFSQGAQCLLKEK